MDEQIYIDNGFESREDYFEYLAEEYGAPIEVVYAIADVYGANEDFDGLVTALEDHGGEI